MARLFARGPIVLRAMIPAVILSPAVLTPALAAGPENLRVHYTIRLIGLPLGTATLAASLDPAVYKLEVNARLSGVASIISNARGAATASGVFMRGRVAPNGFATTSANAQMTRTIRIAMNAGTVRASEIAPPFESPPDRIPILEAHKRNVVDPLSAFVMPVSGAGPVAGPEACNRTLPVFDGWTRFDIGLSYVGDRQVEVRGYSGPVAVCAARYTPISGHRNRPIVQFMADNKEMEVWLAPVGDSRVTIPFRISVATLIGMVVIEATEFETTPTSTAARR